MLKLILAAGLLLATSQAQALDFTQVLMDDDNCPLRDDPSLTTTRTSSTVARPECPGIEKSMTPDLTLGLVVYHALLMTFQEDKFTGEQKQQRGDLARRVRAAKDTMLTADEVVLAKQAVGKLWNPLVISIVFPLLDPATAPKK